MLASRTTYTPNTVFKKSLNNWINTIHNWTLQHSLEVEHRFLHLKASQRKAYNFWVHVNLHLCLWTLIRLYSNFYLCTQSNPSDTPVAITISLSDNTSDIQNCQIPFQGQYYKHTTLKINPHYTWRFFILFLWIS